LSIESLINFIISYRVPISYGLTLSYVVIVNMSVHPLVIAFAAAVIAHGEPVPVNKLKQFCQAHVTDHPFKTRVITKKAIDAMDGIEYEDSSTPHAYKPADPTAETAATGIVAAIPASNTIGSTVPGIDISSVEDSHIEDSPISTCDALGHFESLSGEHSHSAPPLPIFGSHELDGYFVDGWHGISSDTSAARSRAPLLDWEAAIAASGPQDFCLFGVRTGAIVKERRVALNVTEPFCLLAVGLQGSGKSHTIGTVIEACAALPITGRLRSPMPVLVLHYDDSTKTPCECASVVLPNARLPALANAKDCAAKRLVVLVSPTFYLQRKQMYSTLPRVTVRPLLFSWDKLNAEQIKVLMGAEDQLYMKKFLSELRKYQSENLPMPPFEKFRKEIMESFDNAKQSGPLGTRFDLLAPFLAESDESKKRKSTRGFEAVSLEDIVEDEPGTVVIADLVDPLLTAGTANGIFQVLLEQFRDVSATSKLCVFDEAHKYMSGDKAQSGMLAASIVNTMRQMRHYGLRIAISTQSPTELPPEAVELSSVVVCHQFHSRDWFDFLKRKVNLPEGGFGTIQKLRTGEALVFASKFGNAEGTQTEEVVNSLTLGMRRRITADGGASVTHAATSRNLDGAEGR